MPSRRPRIARTATIVPVARTLVLAPACAMAAGVNRRLGLGRVVLMILLFSISACHATRRTTSTPVATPTLSDRAAYPAHWWAPVPKEGAPAWEILPQEARPGEAILSKRHELGLLSNFAATPFTYRDRRYASLEGFWKMMLYPEDAEDPRATYPGLEWKYTRGEKVRQNPEVQRVLLATGDLVLKPDHHQDPDAPPEWRYFEILTRIRAELAATK